MAEVLLAKEESSNKRLLENSIRQEKRATELEQRLKELQVYYDRLKEDSRRTEALLAQRDSQMKQLIAKIKTQEKELISAAEELRKRSGHIEHLKRSVETASKESELRSSITSQRMGNPDTRLSAKDTELRLMKDMMKSYHVQYRQRAGEVQRFKKATTGGVKLPSLGSRNSEISDKTSSFAASRADDFTVKEADFEESYPEFTEDLVTTPQPIPAKSSEMPLKNVSRSPEEPAEPPRPEPEITTSRSSKSAQPSNQMKAFKVVLIGANQEAAASIAEELAYDADNATETYFETTYEDWKLFIFVTYPESTTVLPKVVDAVVLHLEAGTPSAELKDYFQQFEGVIHKIAQLTSSDDLDSVSFATELGIRVTEKRGFTAQFPTFLALDAELTELIQRTLAEFDRDSSGSIDVRELNEISRQLGRQLSEAELHAALRDLDTSQDSKISLEEFTDWWKSGRQGKNQVMRSLTRGVAKVKHFLDNAHAEIVRLTEDAEEKYSNVKATITKGALSSPSLGFSIAAYNSENEVRTSADGHYPEDNKSYYIQLAVKTVNPEAFALKAKELYKEAVKACAAVLPEVSMTAAYVTLSTSSDADHTYLNFSSTFAKLFVQRLVKYRGFLCPQHPSFIKVDFFSEGDLCADIDPMANADLRVDCEWKLTQVLQQLFLEFAETLFRVEGAAKSVLLSVCLIGLLQGMSFSLSTLPTTDLPGMDEIRTMFGDSNLQAVFRDIVSHPAATAVVNQLKTEIDASEVRAVVAADILTVAATIYAKNLSKFLLA
jgi:Ca2+-binding EF-hand superfamily protein